MISKIRSRTFSYAIDFVEMDILCNLTTFYVDIRFLLPLNMPYFIICDCLSKTRLVCTCQYFKKYYFKKIQLKNQPCLGSGVIH